MTNQISREIKENMMLQRNINNDIKVTTRKVKYIVQKELREIIKLTDNMNEAFTGKPKTHSKT